MRAMIAIPLLVVLTGCSGMGRAISVYGDSAVQRSEFDFQDHTYRMFDRKDLNSIMVTPSFGDSLKSGAIKGATFGGLNIQDDKGRFTAVTLSYLEKERPNEVCNVDKAEILIDPQWELFYTCKVKTGN